MKKVIAILMTLVLLLSCISALMEEIVRELPAEEPEPSTWDCPACGAAGNTGKFCEDCGAPRPVSAEDDPGQSENANGDFQRGSVVFFDAVTGHKPASDAV